MKKNAHLSRGDIFSLLLLDQQSKTQINSINDYIQEQNATTSHISETENRDDSDSWLLVGMSFAVVLQR